jgi:hypothetical protein
LVTLNPNAGKGCNYVTENLGGCVDAQEDEGVIEVEI